MFHILLSPPRTSNLHKNLYNAKVNTLFFLYSELLFQIRLHDHSHEIDKIEGTNKKINVLS